MNVYENNENTFDGIDKIKACMDEGDVLGAQKTILNVLDGNCFECGCPLEDNECPDCADRIERLNRDCLNSAERADYEYDAMKDEELRWSKDGSA